MLQRLQLSEGSWLLVHGAAGGVGHLLVQMARRRGLHIAAASPPADRDWLLGLGVDVWIDRADPEPAAAAAAMLGHELDAAVDLVGGLATAAFPYLRVGGGYASVVDLSGDLDLAVDRNLDIHGVLLRPTRDLLVQLAEEVAEGLRPRVVDSYPIERAADAHLRVESGRVSGKVAVTVR